MQDLISSIFTDLVTEVAAACLKGLLKGLLAAYACLKGLPQRKYGQVDVAVLETAPSSQTRQAVIKEDVEKTGARQDEEGLCCKEQADL